MKLFKYTIYFLAAICLITGASDFLQGMTALKAFGADLSETAKTWPVADNIFRFFAAVWFGVGILLILFAKDIARYKPALMTLLGIIALGGIGRIISILQYGMPAETSGLMVVIAGLFAELLITPILMIVLLKFKSNYHA